MKRRMMKRDSLFLVFVVAAVSLPYQGCGTYKGRLNPRTPVDERVLLEVPVNVILNQFDGEAASWAGSGSTWAGDTWFLTIPAGKHTFGYTWWEGFYAHRGLEITYTFEPGRHYVFVSATITRQDGETQVVFIPRESPASPKFKDGVYSGMDHNGVVSFGSTSASVITAEIGFLDRYVHDGGVRWGIYADWGVGVGMTIPLGMDLSPHFGLLGNFYIPGTNFGIGAGGGYRLDSFLTGGFTSGGAIWYPYIKAAVFPTIFGRRLYAYFDYYLDYDGFQVGVEPRVWGVGAGIWF
jgi:hypothetical protein